MSGTIRLNIIDDLDDFWNVWRPFEKNEKTVDVFLVDLTCVAAIQPILVEEEYARSERFCQAADQLSFKSSRTILRQILARFLNTNPLEVVFRSNSFGKPFLAGSSSWKFNLSRSAGKALISVAYDKDLGIDLERHRQVDELGIAQRYFSRSEFSRLSSLDATRRRVAFFDCWTLKEAFVKSQGLGLQVPLDQFEVDFETTSAAQSLKSCQCFPESAEQCFLSKLPIEKQYSAAIAIRNQEGMEDWTISYASMARG